MADPRPASIVDRLKERAAEVEEARSVGGTDNLAAVAGPPAGPDRVLDSILPTQHLANLPIDLVGPAPEGQVRQDFDEERLQALAGSLRRSGIREPIIVTPHGAEPGHFLIVAGERRWRAAKLAGLAEVPCLVDPSLRDRRDKVLAQAEENFHRENLNPVEEAAALAQLMEARGIGTAEAGELLGKSGTQARRLLQLHEAPVFIKEALALRRLDARAALELLRILNNALREQPDGSAAEPLETIRALMEQSIAESWPIRRLERLGKAERVPEARHATPRGRSAPSAPAEPPGDATTIPPSPAPLPDPGKVAAAFEQSDDRLAVDIRRIRQKSLSPAEREALIDALENLLLLLRAR
jgi:ParB family chromosome partitioning protein